MDDWKKPAPMRVVDLGAGTGLFSSMVLAKYLDTALLLSDASEGMLQQARRRFDGYPSVGYRIADMATDELGGPWDLVISTLAIHHLADDASPAVRDRTEPAIRRIIEGVCQSTGADFSISYTRQYPTLVNDEAAAEVARKAAAEVYATVNTNPPRTMIVEDFAFMLEDRPGCYAWVGNGSDDNRRILHSAWYDFNDEILPFGASYFARLVEQQQPTAQNQDGTAVGL